MVLTGAGDAPRTDGEDSPQTLAARELIWHDLECGGYDADLALWRTLATRLPDGSPADPILEIGAGSGRVALDLARAGHRVSALDLDGRLLAALSERAAGIGVDVETFRADARTFDLAERRFGLCLAPMQALQLLGGEAGRVAFMRRARAHLRPGGVLACAIVTDFDCFDCSRGDDGPTPETASIQGALYVSRTVRVSARKGGFSIERARSVLPPRGVSAAPRSALAHGVGELSDAAAERDVIVLDLVSVEQLHREALAADLRPAPTCTIEATDDYVASTVVMLHA